MALDTTGSIATHIAESFVLPLGVSGNLVETVDMSRIDVQNYVGQTISPDAIAEAYQSPIVNFSKAQALDEAFSWAATVATSGNAVILTTGVGGVDKIRLGELEGESESKSETDALNAISTLSKSAPGMFRKMGWATLESIGRKATFAKSLS